MTLLLNNGRNMNMFYDIICIRLACAQQLTNGRLILQHDVEVRTRKVGSWYMHCNLKTVRRRSSRYCFN